MREYAWMKRIAAAVCWLLATGVAHATEGTVVGDTYVNRSHPSTNYGGLSNLYVSANGTSLIQLDLSSLPAGTTASQIGKATLKLFVNRINSSGLVSMAPVTSSWSEASLTYASMPSLGPTALSFTPTTAGQFVVVDITALVQGWVTTPSSNYGIALTTVAGDVVFDSKENDETSHAADLDLTIVSHGPAGPAGPMGATGAQGSQGQPGVPGIPGVQGLPGIQGSQGAAGLTGATGPIGPAGVQGTAGSPGPTGLTGAIGLTGPIGLTGSTGSTGPAGANGAQGIQGVPGATGAAGRSITFAGTWDILAFYQPGSTVAYNGSSYLALVDNNDVVPTSDPTIWAVLALEGVAGSAGPAGVPGATGPTGATGGCGSCWTNWCDRPGGANRWGGCVVHL